MEAGPERCATRRHDTRGRARRPAGENVLGHGRRSGAYAALLLLLSRSWLCDKRQDQKLWDIYAYIYSALYSFK